MSADLINDEILRIKRELAATFDYDVHAIFADLRRREAGLGDRLVRQSQTQWPNQPMRGSGEVRRF
jgi:hypothetical protein